MKESRIAFSSSFILPPSSFVCAPNRFALVAEAHLQLDAAVAGGLVDAAVAEADRFAQTHVDGEEGRAGAVVARDDDLSRLRVEVERAEARDAHAGAREVCGEGRAVVKERVAVQVSPDGDVEGAARRGRDE